jgi:hypothetical protein
MMPVGSTRKFNGAPSITQVISKCLSLSHVVAHVNDMSPGNITEWASVAECHQDRLLWIATKC